MKSVVFIILSFLLLNICSCSLFEEQDETPPEVEILFPYEGATVSNIVSIKVSAIDNEKIKKVVLYVDFEILETIEGNLDLYEFEWNSDLVENDEYQIYAKAYDDSENESISNTITINVTNYRHLNVVNNCIDNVHFSFADTSGYISFKDSLLVRVEKNRGLTNFYAMTGCYYDYDDGIGVYWDFDVDIKDEDKRIELNVSSELFFLIIQNNTSVYFDLVEVNKDLTDGYQWEYVTIPNNSIWYTLGFYKAFQNSNVWIRLVNHPQYTYYYWDPIELNWETNQFCYISVTDLAKSSSEINEEPLMEEQIKDEEPILIMGSYSNTPVKIH